MDFDRHCTSAARLAILSGLVGGQPLSFMDLKKVTGLADGNLYVQCGRLTEAGYLERTQGGETGRTKTF